MGVTISHTTLSPISFASTLIGFISFAFTLATFLNVFWSSLCTIKTAPHEIKDYLSNLKQALLEERRHLRKVRKRIRSSRRNEERSRSRARESHHMYYMEDIAVTGRKGPGRGRRSPRSAGGNHGDRQGQPHNSYFARDEQALRSRGEEESLRVARTAVRDMIRSFRTLEHPFLKPSFQNKDSTHWSTNTPLEKTPAYTSSYSPHADDLEYDSDSGFGRSNRFGEEYRVCGLRERWLWLRRKQDVVSLSEMLNRVEGRRTAHELGEVLMMVQDLGRDLGDVREGLRVMEGRMSRVVEVRRVD
ncbi:hypothetical protein DM02DRAFT_683956 [Periconia macrospinosa]|uniref:Uncharacterized protein n=1 Tax=Periconia macrospinosa TaxID=97972 RepID=A0A2V1E5A9_9PLEO|nr:hypothetical protein DM02DRAFT_683956 [Periconia macrospinosa]